MPTRAVTVMGLLQIALLSVAWALTVRFLRTAERLWDADGYLWGYETPLFQWLSRYRNWGLWLLAVPVLVAVVCKRLTATHRDIAIVGDGGFYLAALVTLLTLAFAVFVVWASTQFAFGGRIYTHFGG